MSGENEIIFAKSILTVKAVVVDEDGKILLLQRSKKSLNPEKWDLPGGHLEKGEFLEDSLKREIKEETGLDVEVGEIFGFTEFKKEAKQFKEEKRGLRFLAYLKSGEVELDEDEHQDFDWLSFDEALEKLSEKDGFENEKREAIQKARELLQAKNAVLGWKRALADLENYKKRSEKENADFKKYSLECYIADLLPVVDNFELALKHVPEEESKNNWIVGILHIKNQLNEVLTNNGVSEIETKKGDNFDENIHEILEGKSKEGKVAEVVKKGYKMGDKIIRPVTIKVK